MRAVPPVPYGSLSKPDTGWPDNRQPVGEVHFEHFVEPLTDKCNDGAASRGVGSKQDYSGMLRNRVALEIGDTLVKREQNPPGSERGATTAGSAAPRRSARR